MQSVILYSGHCCRVTFCAMYKKASCIGLFWEKHREYKAGQLEKHETGPRRMAKARPEVKISSQILRSRSGVCC